MTSGRWAHVCEVGQEKDERGKWKWTLPYAEPCKCTSVMLGGKNTVTHVRPLKPTYVDKPLLSNEIATIRKHYGLQCPGKNDLIIFCLLFFFIMDNVRKPWSKCKPNVIG